MSAPLSWLNDGLAELRERSLIRRRRQVRLLPDGWCEIDGKRLRNFAANDYLNLAHDPRVVAAARDALEEMGVGSRASALVTGRTDWHVRLEERLASFEEQPAAVLFPTGYAANVGTITALVSKEDVIFSDQLNHASLIDGCRLSRAVLKIYPHADVATLESELKQANQFRRRWIISDSLFSMDGDAAPLNELCDLAEQFDASVLIDEAHATGVFGENGRGVAEWQDVEGRVQVRIGTLSKAVGTSGGFVAGPQELIDWLWNRARTQIFSTAMPPAICAAACTAIDIIAEEPWRRERLHALADQLRTAVTELGLQTVPNAVGPIVPVILNDAETVVAVAARLEERGFLVGAIRPPTVPKGTSRLRITLSCAHTDEDVRQLANALADTIPISPR